VTGWSLNVRIEKEGINHLAVQGFDAQGNLLSNATPTITVVSPARMIFPPAIW